MILNYSIQIEVDDSHGENWAPYHKYQLQQHFRNVEKWGTGKLRGLVFIPMTDPKIFNEHEYLAWTQGEIEL